MLSLQQEYQQHCIPHTIKIGRFLSGIGMLFIIYFAIADIIVLKIEGTLPWRLIGILSTAIFLISSYTWLKKDKSKVYITYTIPIIGILVMMSGIALLIFSNSSSNDSDFAAVTIGFISVWFVLSITAAGLRPWFPYISLVWAIVFGIGLAFCCKWGDHGAYIGSIYLLAIFTNIITWQQYKANFKNFQINRLLEDKEKELKVKNEDISKQNTQLKNANDRLKVINEQLENFARVTSHDLSEPLRLINSFGKLLQNKNKNKLDPESNEYLEYMVAASHRMRHLITQLLKYSKITTQDYVEKETVDMNQIFKEVQQDLSLRIQETKTVIDVKSKLPVVSGNSSLLIQLFQNLLSNSIKFQPPGQAPKVVIESNRVNGHYLITFKDNGIGIPESSYKRIFDVFGRLHTAGEYEGSGIGLATCKKIVEQFGGTINVESKEGVGSTFLIEWPVLKIEEMKKPLFTNL